MSAPAPGFDPRTPADLGRRANPSGDDAHVAVGHQSAHAPVEGQGELVGEDHATDDLGRLLGVVAGVASLMSWATK